MFGENKDIYIVSKYPSTPPQNTQGQNLQWTNLQRRCPNQVIKVNVTINTTEQHDGSRHTTHC